MFFRPQFGDGNRLVNSTSLIHQLHLYQLKREDALLNLINILLPFRFAFMVKLSFRYENYPWDSWKIDIQSLSMIICESDHKQSKDGICKNRLEDDDFSYTE
jgi:hypothetical protein